MAIEMEYQSTLPNCLQIAITTLIICQGNFIKRQLSHLRMCPWKFMMTSSNENIFRVTGHLCGDSPVHGEFPTQKPVTRSSDVFFDLRLNKRLSKQWWCWWFETPSCPLWHHCNVGMLEKMIKRKTSAYYASAYTAVIDYTSGLHWCYIVCLTYFVINLWANLTSKP